MDTERQKRGREAQKLQKNVFVILVNALSEMPFYNENWLNMNIKSHGMYLCKHNIYCRVRKQPNKRAHTVTDVCAFRHFFRCLCPQLCCR